MKKICVVGLGYIGLPTASLIAVMSDFEVLGVDVNPSVVDALRKAEVTIHEPGLDDWVKKAVGSGKLKASLRPEAADVFVIAVPTPFKENKTPDMTYVIDAFRSLAPFLREGNLVILESTSPVGATENLANLAREMRPDLRTSVSRSSEEPGDGNVHFAYCPERVLPGKIFEELVDNDRIVGGLGLPAAELAGKFYRSFVRGQVHVTDSRTAELAKLAENSFRDVNIAFANELSLISDRLGIDVWELIKLANRHPRVNILQPGPGVGGHCIAVDPWFIVAAAPEQARLIRTAREVNDAKPHHVVERIIAAAKDTGSQYVACFGLAFKPDIDDVRESPALEIVAELAQRGFAVKVVDPYVGSLPKRLAGLGAELCTAERAIEDCDVLALLVDHTPFKPLIASLPPGKAIVDTRGIWT